MQTTRLIVASITILVASVAPVPAQARECAGYDTQTLISAEVTEVAKGHVLVTFRNCSTVITDADSISNMTMGECSGTALTTPDGKTRSAGHCARQGQGR